MQKRRLRQQVISLTSAMLGWLFAGLNNPWEVFFFFFSRSIFGKRPLLEFLKVYCKRLWGDASSWSYVYGALFL